jgi:hypothetical protein
MNVNQNRLGSIVGGIAVLTWLLSSYEAVRSARWFLSNDSVLEIIGINGIIVGLAGVALILLERQFGNTRQTWMLYGVCATVAVVLKLTETTYLGFSKGLDLNGIVFIIAMVVAFLGYQQADT